MKPPALACPEIFLALNNLYDRLFYIIIIIYLHRIRKAVRELLRVIIIIFYKNLRASTLLYHYRKL